MVVNYRAMSNANYALRGFCPNVLALKAVLMILDVPGPQRRIANRYALTDTGLVPTSRLLVSDNVIPAKRVFGGNFDG
jgi:hypothetical protein